MSSSDSDREVISILTNSSETEEDNRRVRIYKERVNYLATLVSYEFQVRFRLDKESTKQLLLEINPHIRVTGSRNHGISPLHQLLMTLRFYALGTMLLSDFVGVSWMFIYVLIEIDFGSGLVLGPRLPGECWVSLESLGHEGYVASLNRYGG
ncbi:hypothetical protein ACJJTC_007939 [Scirpophaga incertulas]